MSTTVSMWLGIAFVALGIIATILQAWLWSFPMEPDPGGPDPNGKSTAPRFWTNMHRFTGVAFVLIYIVLMIEMVPRLWEYQIELPARTVIHAVMGICIGVILIAKLAIIRWFQHFGKSLPALGFLLILCTLILATLSIPHALRAFNFDFSEEQITQTKNALMKSAAWIEGSDLKEKQEKKRKDFPQHNIDDVMSKESLKRGQEVLNTKCTICHDLKTVMSKSRQPDSWYKVVRSMAAKPTTGDKITEEEIPQVAAYLVLLDEAAKQMAIEEARKRQAAKKKEPPSAPPAEENQTPKEEPKEGTAPEGTAPEGTVPEGTAPEGTAPEGTAPEGTEPEKTATPTAPVFDMAAAKELYEESCTLCHELDLVEGYGNQSAEKWRELVVKMSDDEGGEFEPEDMETIIRYLSTIQGVE